MKRDFTEATKTEFINLVQEANESEWLKKKNPLDNVDDLLTFDVQFPWNTLEAYYRKMIDKNDMTVGKINKIWENVQILDSTYQARFLALNELAVAYKEKLRLLSNKIKPENIVNTLKSPSRQLEAELVTVNEKLNMSRKYDEIEGSTSILFSTTSSLREAITTALNSMSGRFQSGTYIPRTGFDWKKIMEVECLKLESWLKAKEELKLSESETEYLKQKGIVLTTMDIACIKRTEGTELVFLSKDKKALFYKGEIYPIYVPDNEISFQPIWKLDGKKEISAMEFDALEGILGFSLEEIPKEDIYTTSGHKVLSGELSSTDPNVKAAAGLSALLGLTQFTLSSLSKSEVTVIFQSSEGGNRGTICVGNSEDRATFQNWNYNIPMDTYRDSEPGIGKIWASDYAAGIYKIASGKDVPNPDGTYTITGTLDERHKDTNISGYLSYSTDGKLMYTPLIYSGDKAYIESVDGFMEFGRTQILDFSDKLSTPSFADEDSQKLLEELLKGENE